MHDHAPYLSTWDKDAIELLKPLAAKRATVHFPFFANTLPLAFHYRHALLNARIKATECKPLVQLYEWGQQLMIFERAPSDSLTVCYGSWKEVRSLKRRGYKLRIVEIETYRPQFVFSEMNLILWDLREKLVTNQDDPAQVPFVEVMPSLPKLFPHIEIFTDILPQAIALLKPIFAKSMRSGGTYSFLCPSDSTSLFDDTHIKTPALRLFFYGAPMTHYFLQKDARYIPFQIDPLRRSHSAFRTVVAITGDQVAATEVQETLRRYHKLLFVAARAEADHKVAGSFRALQHYYNRFARLLAHRSSFSSSVAYAACVHQHKR